jgi:YD repeat-containing protein
MKKAILLLCVAAFVCSTASAQYETWRFPQKAEEIQKIKTAGIERVTVFAEINGSQVPYGIRFYDKEGRIVRNVDAQTHAYYWYDAQGKVLKCVDSSFDGRRFFPTSYAFSYAPDGSLKGCQIGKTDLSFTYNAANRELSEVENESTTRYYRYNEDGKLIEDVSGDAENPYRRKLVYNKYGDLASEVLVRSTATSKDSIITVYSFDSKSHLVRKQTNTFHTDISEDPTMPVSETKKIEIWAYTYAMNGTMTTETKTSPTHPAENYKVEYQYDNMKLLPLKEMRYNSQNKLEKTFVYKYNEK